MKISVRGRRIKSSLGIITSVRVGSVSKRTLAANDMSAWQQVRIWSLDNFVLYYVDEILLNMMFNYNKHSKSLYFLKSVEQVYAYKVLTSG